jgi:hypothetical protein
MIRQLMTTARDQTFKSDTMMVTGLLERINSKSEHGGRVKQKALSKQDKEKSGSGMGRERRAVWFEASDGNERARRASLSSLHIRSSRHHHCYGLFAFSLPVLVTVMASPLLS